MLFYFLVHWVPLTTSIQLVVNGTCYNRTSFTLVSMTEISAHEKKLLVVTGCSYSRTRCKRDTAYLNGRFSFWCIILKHPVHSLATLPFMGIHPVNYRTLWDACPYMVGGGAIVHGACLKILHRVFCGSSCLCWMSTFQSQLKHHRLHGYLNKRLIQKYSDYEVFWAKIP